MTCVSNKPYYIPPNQSGLKLVNSLGTGIDIELFWYPAYTDNINFKLAYNIYFSTEEENVFSEGPKFVSTNLTGLYTKISNFDPGDTYYFNVRAMEYDPTWMNVNFLPDATDGYQLKIYPETLLVSNISAQSTVIPITDINLFPPMGIFQIGYELIRYDSKDIPNGTLLVAERGFLNSQITLHNVDGYDGYVQQSPIIKFWKGLEDQNTLINEEQAAFNYPNFAYTLADGYKVDSDLLTTNLSANDADQQNFPAYDNSGYHEGAADLAILLQGGCLNSYIGGERYCADGYGGVGMQIRNISISDVNDQRQELLLSYTGEPVVLIKRLWSGIRCSCYTLNKESPESRCPLCFGTSFVTGYEQFYDPRRSDSKIMVRFGPYTDDIQQNDAGLESIGQMSCWTLTVPTIRDRDIIQRFNIDGTPEFLYEVLSTERNKLLFGISGNQKFTASRIRRTEAIYSWRKFNDTSTMPHTIQTAVGLLKSSGNTFLPHTHGIVLSEKILAVSQINQTTSVSANHSHEVYAGIVQPSPIDGHTHVILF